METVLEIQSLQKQVKGFALRDVSFSVPKGYVTGLIGPNGAGKTMTIKLIMNLWRKDGGDIHVFGLDALAHEVDIRKRIGFVYDTPFFPPNVKLQYLADTFSAAYPTWKRERFDLLVSRFELPRDKALSKFSKGMQMKACIATALSHDAELLIMDEPTQGLDPVFRIEFLQLLREAVQDGAASVLFSTHITSDLDSIADYVVLLNKGRVVLRAGTDAFRDHWGVIKSPVPLSAKEHADIIKGVRNYSYGCEALTSDTTEARRRFGADIVIDPVTIQDVLFYKVKGESDV
jgi:ABC-2 type transport system ATP-binding protein